MIKFLKISFTFLIFLYSKNALAQYVPSSAEIQKLIQDKMNNVDLESLGLDNTSQNLEKKGNIPQNLIDIIAKREEKTFKNSLNKNAESSLLDNNSKKIESTKTVEPLTQNTKKKFFNSNM